MSSWKALNILPESFIIFLQIDVGSLHGNLKLFKFLFIYHTFENLYHNIKPCSFFYNNWLFAEPTAPNFKGHSNDTRKGLWPVEIEKFSFKKISTFTNFWKSTNLTTLQSITNCKRRFKKIVRTYLFFKFKF